MPDEIVPLHSVSFTMLWSECDESHTLLTTGRMLLRHTHGSDAIIVESPNQECVVMPLGG